MRTLLAAPALILGVALLTACGGVEGEEEDATTGTATIAAFGVTNVTATPQASATPTATPSPTATASTTASGSPSPEPTVPLPTTCVFPSDTKSFRLTMTMGTSPDIGYGSLFGTVGGGRRPTSGGGLFELFGGFSEDATMEFSFVAPDRWSVVVSEDGQECCSYIVIGPQVWYRAADSTDWTEQPAPGESTSFTPQDFCEVVEGLPMSMELEGEETVNGVETVHYQSSHETSMYGWLVGEDDSLDYSYDVWLAEDGNWPVKLIYDADCEIRWEISDLNDPSITVEPPTLR